MADSASDSRIVMDSYDLSDSILRFNDPVTCIRLVSRYLWGFDEDVALTAACFNGGRREGVI